MMNPTLPDWIVAFSSLLAAVGAWFYWYATRKMLAQVREQSERSFDARLGVRLFEGEVADDGVTVVLADLECEPLGGEVALWIARFRGTNVNLPPPDEKRFLYLELRNKGQTEVAKVVFRLKLDVKHHDEVVHEAKLAATFDCVYECDVERGRVVRLRLCPSDHFPVYEARVSDVRYEDGLGKSYKLRGRDLEHLAISDKNLRLVSSKGLAEGIQEDGVEAVQESGQT